MDQLDNLSPTPVENTETEPDWSREKCERWWHPGPQLLKSIRQYQKWHKRGGFIGNLIAKYYVLTYHFWSIVTGSDIPINSQIGGGLLLPHPTGVVIHPKAVIGNNCTIFQQVTIVAGVKVGHGVLIGTGAKILRKVTIGDYAKVGANAVLLECEVPPRATAVGIPAKIILPRENSSSNKKEEAIL